MNGFSVRDVISSAWKNIKGTKWPIWGVLLVLFLIVLGLGLITGLITGLFGFSILKGGAHGGHVVAYFLIMIIFEVVTIFLTVPLTAGAQMIALKKARGETVSASTGFGYWGKWFPLGLTIIYFSIGAFLVYLIFSFLAGLSMVMNAHWLGAILGILGVIAVILFYTFFLFNLLFVADKQKGPFGALLCSAKAVAPHWFRVLLLWIYIFIVLIVGLLPLFLGLICPAIWVKVLGAVISIVLFVWVVPYLHLILATAYNKLSSNVE